jgi:D-3-phosphoglycerate dehydrogenase
MVVNAPDSNIHSVAEHAMTMILSIAKNVARMDREVRKGRFESRDEVIGIEIKGKKVGIIGLGQIGLILADMLRGFDVEMIGYDPYANEAKVKEAGIEIVDDSNKIYSEADIITLHLPLTDETEGMIGEDEFAMMKENAFFINTARGPIADEEVLYQFLKEGKIKGAALDVFAEEPPPEDNPLFELDNVVLSPHNAALTEEALIKMATHSSQGVVDALRGEKPKYLVNPEVMDD